MMTRENSIDDTMDELGAATTNFIVFVVDDDESVCKALNRLIRSAGYEARVFTSALEFLNQDYQDTPGCLILDVRMPIITGLELQKKLVTSGSKIPIIFMSAHEDIKAKEQALQSGAVAFLQKPFEDQILLDVIYSVLKKFSDNKKSPDS